ncbi:unnamed protein product, partial [Didymodactylos carnosus]
QRTLDMLHKENKLEKQLDRMDLRKPSKWTDVDADQVDFPQLSEDSIRELALEIVRAFTQVINMNMAFYWGTLRWSPTEIMIV